MSKLAYIFFANGFEEVEALSVVDILRRGGVTVEMVSIDNSDYVTSSHNVTLKMDKHINEIDKNAADIIILPGGMPGTTNLANCSELTDMIKSYNSEGKRIAAICAAPTVFGGLGLLNGKKAICYPGMEDKLEGALVTVEEVVTDGNITTSRGLGTAIPFGLELLKLLVSEEAADKISNAIVFRQ